MDMNYHSALDVVFTPVSRLNGVLHALSENDNFEVDYLIERMLDEIRRALANDAVEFDNALSKLGKSQKELGRVLQKVWLEGEVPRCGFEVKVRASEVLGLWSIKVKEPKAAIVKRLSSKRFEHRMWAARSLRLSDWSDVDTLLAPLAYDSYEDDNGFFLVREAAGFCS